MKTVWRHAILLTWVFGGIGSEHAASDGASCLHCANRRFLAVHVQKGGRRRLRLKERAAKVIDLLTDATVGEDLTEFEAEFSTPDTRLYELVPRETQLAHARSKNPHCPR